METGSAINLSMMFRREHPLEQEYLAVIQAQEMVLSNQPHKYRWKVMNRFKLPGKDKLVIKSLLS
jgi:hypothetical protein